jgi:hypothetical protein
MAKTVLERCDLVVGQAEGADYFVAVSSYKVGEGDAKETRYAFGAYLTYPAEFKVDSNLGKAAKLWAKRQTSADNAGLKAKIAAGEITTEDAAATIMSYNGDEFITRMNETKVREGGAGPVVSTPEKKAIKDLEYVLRTKTADGSIKAAKVPVPRLADPPQTAKGQTNFNAWAKAIAAEGHPWYATLLKQAQAAGSKLD